MWNFNKQQTIINQDRISNLSNNAMREPNVHERLERKTTLATPNVLQVEPTLTVNTVANTERAARIRRPALLPRGPSWTASTAKCQAAKSVLGKGRTPNCQT